MPVPIRVQRDMTDIDLLAALRAECVKRGMSEADHLVVAVDRRVLELLSKYNEPPKFDNHTTEHD